MFKSADLKLAVSERHLTITKKTRNKRWHSFFLKKKRKNLKLILFLQYVYRQLLYEPVSGDKIVSKQVVKYAILDVDRLG